MDLLLHPPDDAARHRPDARGRLSTVGHRAAFRAFVRAAKRAGIEFMVIGGTFRDVAVRAASTRDIDVVLIDRAAMPADMMRAAGFAPVAGSPHAWRRVTKGRSVDLEIAAVASSTSRRGPFSVAYRHADRRVIEGCVVAVPRLEDYVILKLLAAAADPRRRNRDVADVQSAFEADRAPGPGVLSIPALRARLRDAYGISGAKLRSLVLLLRQVPR